MNNMIITGQKNREAILRAMPGTASSICERTGINRGTIDGILKRMIDEKLIRVIDRRVPSRGGFPTAIYDDIRGRGLVPIAMPETQFHTQWVGGAHPCEQVNPWTRMAA
jgi:hypothetical protein